MLPALDVFRSLCHKVSLYLNTFMDLYVERQCVDEMKAGKAEKFLMLFDANFEDVYKYVARRVVDGAERERIVRLTFLDALGQIQNTPTDSTYLVWLFSLARPRVWDHIAKASFPETQGLISAREKVDESSDELVRKADKIMGKLSLEEREILRLKFFEQVSDGDVMTILAMTEGSIGPKIYRVLKRAHFLLFGESDERKGVYFGELSGFFERLRGLESIEVLEVLKLSLKTDVTTRIQKKNFAVEAEVVMEKKASTNEKVPTGSNDPAKIFVEAVREMREDEAKELEKERMKFEKSERVLDFVDRWKGVLTLIPVAIFLMIFTSFLLSFLDFGRIERGFPNNCDIEIVFDGDFTDAEKRSVNNGVSAKLCDHFEVERLVISRLDEGKLEVEVDVPEWFLEYTFVKKVSDWRIKKYARTLNSDGEPGQV